MAKQTDAPTDDAQPETTFDADTVDVEVIYHRGAHTADAADIDPESDLYDLTRELGCRGTDTFDHRDITVAEAIAGAYTTIGRTTMDTSDVDSLDRFLEAVWTACQGGRRNDLYDGSQTRSMMVGDVVIVDGDAYMVAMMGFEPVDVDYRGQDDDEEPDETTECPRCHGRGEVMVGEQKNADGTGVKPRYEPCRECDGSGEVEV